MQLIGGDGIGITAAQAAAVSSVGTVFKGNTTIKSFNELSKFNITVLPSACFNGCTSLKNIDTSLITSLKNQQVFNGCASLESVNLSNCTYIGANAFCNCASLSSVGSLEKVTSIGQYGVFQNCSSLKIDLYLPNLTTLNGTFEGSGILNVVSLGTVTTMSSTFYQCKSLKTVTLPATLQSLTGQTFNGCTSLLWVKLLSTSVVTLSLNYCFSGTNNCPIYVPDDLVDAYKVATNWSSYASRIFSLTQFAIDFPNG